MRPTSNLETIYWLLVVAGVLPAIWIAAGLLGTKGGAGIISVREPVIVIVFVTLFVAFLVVAHSLGEIWRVIPGLPLLLLSLLPAYNNLVYIEPAVRIGIPSKSVVAFSLEGCPEGWTAFAPAVGRFIRGIGQSAGDRKVGSLEEDAFQGHTFGDGSGKILKFSNAGTNTVASNTGFSDMPSTGIFGKNPAFGTTSDSKIVTTGQGEPRIAEETRPKNVGLLFCMRD